MTFENNWMTKFIYRRLDRPTDHSFIPLDKNILDIDFVFHRYRMNLFVPLQKNETKNSSQSIEQTCRMDYLKVIDIIRSIFLLK